VDALAASTLQERLNTLSGDQKQLLGFIAKDYRDKDIIGEPEWDDSGKLLDGIRSLFDHFGLDRIPYDECREQLATIGRENGFLTLNAGDTVPPEKTLPGFDLQSVVKKIYRLDNDEKALLQWYAFAVPYQDSHAKKAKEIGVGTQTVIKRLKRICEKLNVPYGNEYQNGLKTAWQEFQGRLNAGLRTETAEPAEPAAETEGEIPKEEPTTLAEASPAVQPLMHQGQGSGVVLPLPVDVTDVQVVSGFFDGKTSPGLRESIQVCKQQGFRPEFLVLTSAPNSEVCHVQLVFFEHENKD
jgi:hypothetical protein